MPYSSPTPDPLWNPAPAESRDPGCKLEALYQVSVRFYQGGHACTEMFRLEPRTRQMLAEQGLCYQTTVASERVAHALISDTIASRLWAQAPDRE